MHQKDRKADKVVQMNAEARAAEITRAESPATAYAEDYALAQQIAEGDRAVFRIVYERNSRTLYNLALRLTGSQSEAEDIVQETFVKVYQKIDMYAGKSALSSWIYRICMNIGLEHLRKKKGTFEDLNDSNCGSVEPDHRKLLLQRKLDKAIPRLPEGCRTVFIMHDIEGLNHKEIANRLDLAEGTSKSQLFKARAMLRKLLLGKQA
jgi:RNA polymerase sigma-70 factor (ECF subfamily)